MGELLIVIAELLAATLFVILLLVWAGSQPDIKPEEEVVKPLGYALCAATTALNLIISKKHQFNFYEWENELSPSSRGVVTKSNPNPQFALKGDTFFNCVKYILARPSIYAVYARNDGEYIYDPVKEKLRVIPENVNTLSKEHHVRIRAGIIPNDINILKENIKRAREEDKTWTL